MSDIINTTNQIANIAFGSPASHTLHVKRVMIRDVCSNPVEFWHALDISDFLSFRSFVVVDNQYFDIDFISRHEIVPPMSIEKLPEGWHDWALVYKNQLIITDRFAFCHHMMTIDAIIALPTYRFEFLIDDAGMFCNDGLNIVLAFEKTLKSLITGYSYHKYDGATSNSRPTTIFNLKEAIP